MKLLVLAALGFGVPGCVASAPVTTDAVPGAVTLSDAPGSDGGTTADAGPGDPGLARAPKNCTTLVNDAAVNAQFGPVWQAHRYVPSGTTDIQEHYLCPSVPGPVLGVVSKYSGAQVPAG